MWHDLFALGCVIGFLLIYYSFTIRKQKRMDMIRKHRELIRCCFRHPSEYIDELLVKFPNYPAIDVGLLIDDNYLYDIRLVIGWRNQILEKVNRLPECIDKTKIYGCVLMNELYVLVINTTDLSHAVNSSKRKFHMDYVVNQLKKDHYIREGVINHYIRSYQNDHFELH